ncbi:MAG: DUF1513 domain-containing protein [Granulosicoccaceae bacterium]
MTSLEQAYQGDNVFLGGSRYNDLDQPDKQRFALSIVNFERRDKSLIDLNFLPHGMCLHPDRAKLVIACEKKGPHGVILNIDTLSVEQQLPLPEGRKFYGHCAFSKDGKYLYTTEVLSASGEGLISVRDGKSGEIVGEFPSFGHAPHECQLIDDGNTMVITNGGGNRNGALPNVAFVDIATQSLIKHEKPSSYAVNTGHFSIAPDNTLVVVSAPRDGLPNGSIGGVSIGPRGKPLRTLSSPKKTVNNMIGEALSVLTVEDRAVVTHPDGDMVTAWSLKNRALIKRLDMPAPRGVSMTRDKKYIVLAFGHDTSLILLDKETLEPKPASLFPFSYIAGSHIYNLADLLKLNC